MIVLYSYHHQMDFNQFLTKAQLREGDGTKVESSTNVLYHPYLRRYMLIKISKESAVTAMYVCGIRFLVENITRKRLRGISPWLQLLTFFGFFFNRVKDKFVSDRQIFQSLNYVGQSNAYMTQYRMSHYMDSQYWH